MKAQRDGAINVIEGMAVQSAGLKQELGGYRKQYSAGMSARSEEGSHAEAVLADRAVAAEAAPTR
jgi:hypothetical protein